MNGSKYKIDTNLLLIGVNTAEFLHESVLLTDSPGEVPVHPHIFNYVKSFVTKPNWALRPKIENV